MTWKNIGDVDPRSGTTFVREMRLGGGDFTAEAIQVIPESAVGGSDAVFDLRQGDLFLAAGDFTSALQSVGSRLDGVNIVRPDHHGGEEIIPLTSDEGLLDLAHAANAYSAVEDPSMTLVRIGLPDRHDPRARFDGELVVYPENTSILAILRRQMDGFDLMPERDPRNAVPLDTDEDTYSGLPRNVETRADLAVIGGFRNLDRDASGNPMPYLNSYEHDGCPEMDEDDESFIPEKPYWQETSTCHAFDREAEMCACPECGVEVSPFEGEWIGPAETDLRNLWDDLPLAERVVEPQDEPGF